MTESPLTSLLTTPTTESRWLASIPSPSQGEWSLGPIPLRAYAFCIIVGIFVAVWVTSRRWQARGGSPNTVVDVAIWAVPFGLVGARLYHVLSSPDAYFGPRGKPWEAFFVWQGGLSVWGAVALGAVGAWIGCRRAGAAFPAFADAAAPGIALAQAVGRWGNWFNQELYGRATDLPWALEITRGDDGREPGLYHPTFLYESLWLLGVAFLVVWADRRFRLGHGRAFALYAAAYCAGRVWIEALRIDPAETVLGLRLNVWTSLVVMTLALAYLYASARLRPGREEQVERTTRAASSPSDPAA